MSFLYRTSRFVSEVAVFSISSLTPFQRFPRTLGATTPKKETLRSLMKIVSLQLLMDKTLVNLYLSWI